MHKKLILALSAGVLCAAYLGAQYLVAAPMDPEFLDTRTAHT